MDAKLKKIIKYNEAALTGSDKSLKAIFEIMFRQEGEVLCESNDGFRIQKITYGQMRKKIDQTACAIYEKIGASHSFVALALDNGADWIAAFWGILKSGNKPYLVNLRYPESLSNDIFKTLDIKYVICDKISPLCAETLLISELSGVCACPEDVFENEIAFSSSATSMKETICFYTGKEISEQILNFKSIIKKSPRMAKHYKGSLKQLAFLPFYHVFGLFAVYFWFTFFGRTLVFLRDLSADTILKTVRRHEVTHIFAVPMLWHTIEKQVYATAAEKGEKSLERLKKGLKTCTKIQNILPFGAELSKKIMSEVTDKLFGRSVMFCINGGSYLRDEALYLVNGLGYCLHNGYGMSEIGITSVELGRTPKERNQNSIGMPFDSVKYRIDESGVLEVCGCSLCTKKLLNGELIETPQWFSTGDIMKEKDGRYYILGRQGDLVIGENGENINPDTVEKLFSLSGAKSLCVLGLGAAQSQELSLVVEITPYTTDDAILKIKNEAYAVNDTLDKAQAVRKFYFTTDPLAPPTAIKVSRTQLLSKIKNGEVNLTEFSSLSSLKSEDSENSPLLDEVIEIIAKTLSVESEKISPDTHIFYELGASSIQYFSILSNLSERFNLADCDKSEKFRYTPREICEFIERYL